MTTATEIPEDGGPTAEDIDGQPAHEVAYDDLTQLAGRLDRLGSGRHVGVNQLVLIASMEMDIEEMRDAIEDAESVTDDQKDLILKWSGEISGLEA